MQIIIDRVLDAPFHALTVTNVRNIISVVPQDWVDELKTIRLHAGQYDYTHRRVLYRPERGRLEIWCRGLSQKTTVREIMRELASLKMPEYRDTYRGYWKNYTKDQLHHLDALISPVLILAMRSIRK